MYSAAIAGPALLFGLYLFLCVAQVDSPFISTQALAGLPAGDRTTLDQYPDLELALRRKGIRYGGEGAAGVTVTSCSGATAWLLDKDSSKAASGCQPATCATPDDDIANSCHYRVRLRESHGVVIGAGLRFGGTPSNQTLIQDEVFVLLMLALFALNFLFLDVNSSSLHGFYRDRLSRLFLFRLGDDGQLVSNDQLRLSQLCGDGTCAPYHLLNAALNLQASVEKSQRGRHSDFFFFSKHYCGSPETGYCETRALEDWDPHIDLGTAMAISAAAASPNMGAMTLRPLVFIMTLLNVRLGYWVPNPAFVRARPVPGRLRPRPRIRYLLREALGALNASTRLVNVSDGGHLENLAIYELLRRKCQLIIVVDAEADPDMSFTGLITVMRLAKIDLGIDIDIDIEPLRPDEYGLTGAHLALGTIDYGDDHERGHILYIKSSMTGDENAFLRRYHDDNPSFPHQTTANQFFREVQFEAYRALGQHVGSAAVADPRARGLWLPERRPSVDS